MDEDKGSPMQSTQKWQRSQVEKSSSGAFGWFRVTPRAVLGGEAEERGSEWANRIEDQGYWRDSRDTPFQSVVYVV